MTDLGRESKTLWLSRPAVDAILSGGLQASVPGHARVWLGDYFKAAEARTAASLDEALGLAPRPLVRGTTDFVLAQAASEPTLEQAMRCTARAYNQLHGGSYNRVRRMNGLLVYVIADARFPYSDMPGDAVTLMLECVLMTLHSGFCALTHRELTPEVLHVATRRVLSQTDDAMQIWPCGVRWGRPWFALAYRDAVADAPVASVGPRPSAAAAQARLMHFVERREAELSHRSDMPASVRDLLRADPLCDQSTAARQLGCSPASLRRQLGSEGLTFRRIRDGVLNDRARVDLLGNQGVGNIAETLGYSDGRSFARAFKRWNGTSPGAFRTPVVNAPSRS